MRSILKYVGYRQQQRWHHRRKFICGRAVQLSFSVFLLLAVVFACVFLPYASCGHCQPVHTHQHPSPGWPEGTPRITCRWHTSPRDPWVLPPFRAGAIIGWLDVVKRENTEWIRDETEGHKNRQNLWKCVYCKTAFVSHNINAAAENIQFSHPSLLMNLSVPYSGVGFLFRHARQRYNPNMLNVTNLKNSRLFSHFHAFQKWRQYSGKIMP